MEKTKSITGIIIQNIGFLDYNHRYFFFFLQCVYLSFAFMHELQIDATKSRVVELIESTLQLTNFDLVASYLLRGENSVKVPATSRIQFDVIGPALSDAQVSLCL